MQVLSVAHFIIVVIVCVCSFLLHGEASPVLVPSCNQCALLLESRRDVPRSPISLNSSHGRIPLTETLPQRSTLSLKYRRHWQRQQSQQSVLDDRWLVTGNGATTPSTCGMHCHQIIGARVIRSYRVESKTLKTLCYPLA